MPSPTCAGNVRIQRISWGRNAIGRHHHVYGYTEKSLLMSKNRRNSAKSGNSTGVNLVTVYVLFFLPRLSEVILEIDE